MKSEWALLMCLQNPVLSKASKVVAAITLVIMRPCFQAVYKAECTPVAEFLWKCVPGFPKLYGCIF